MRLGNSLGGKPPEGLFSGKERFRLLAMAIGAVVLGVLLVYLRARRGGQSASADVPETPFESDVIIAPKIDREALAGLVADARTEDRVILEGAALEAAFAESSPLRDAVFEPLGGRVLDESTRAELLRAPSEHRGDVYRVYGRVRDVQQLASSESGNTRNLLRLELEDGSGDAFAGVMLSPHDGMGGGAGGRPPRLGDFLRFDGLFLKLFRDDTPQGWIEGPLLVGPRVVPSFPRIEPVRELPPGFFADVRDDNMIDGSSGLPTEEYWSLISYVKNLEEGQVDWASTPLLDNETISQIFADGTEWRGKPVRFPVCMVLSLYQDAANENPIRLERLTHGWFGHQPWAGQAKLVNFVSPFEFPEVHQRTTQVTARGFFFKNVAYQPKYGGVAIAPFFVIHSMDVFESTQPVGLVHLMWFVGGALVLIVVVIVALLRRDHARSRALQEDLLRRRRMRRARATTTT